VSDRALIELDRHRKGLLVVIPGPTASPFPVTIEGRRVRLREFAENDLDAIWEWGSDPQFFQFILAEPLGTIAEQRTWLDERLAEAQEHPRHHYHLGIELGQPQTLIGGIEIGIESDHHRKAIIGYGIHPAWWGQGYASEAARLMVGFGFAALGLHRIWATYHPENTASRRILGNLGFRQEGRLRDDRLTAGMWHDSIVCSILEYEWRNETST